MKINRRQFLIDSTAMVGAVAGAGCGRTMFDHGVRSVPTASQPAIAPRKVIPVNVGNGDDLQKALDEHAATAGIVRLQRPVALTCREREATIAGQIAPHALLVPAGTHLDLGGSTLLLDLRSNSYGVRLSNNSAIRNGNVTVIRSEGKGDQGIWHSPISIGAAYGEGGTPQQPGHSSTVSNWAIEDLTIDQPFPTVAIQLMSEAHHGTIRNIRILDSDKALVGIGLDWGSVGPILAIDENFPHMRQLWENGMIYTTHPHDILIENIRVGRLGRNIDANDAGVRCSACHNITIRNLQVDSAATGVAIFGGDCGYEFAQQKQRELAHSGYVIDGMVIEKALRFGIVLNGMADNVYRSRQKHGYDSLRDPVHPGVNKPVIRNTILRGGFTPGAQGMYVSAVTEAALENVDVSEFDMGLHVKDWVHGMRFRSVRVAGNKRNLAIGGSVEPPIDISLEGVEER